MAKQVNTPYCMGRKARRLHGRWIVYDPINPPYRWEDRLSFMERAAIDGNDHRQQLLLDQAITRLSELGRLDRGRKERATMYETKEITDKILNWHDTGRHGAQADFARRLGISRQNLHNKLKRLGLR